MRETERQTRVALLSGIEKQRVVVAVPDPLRHLADAAQLRSPPDARRVVPVRIAQPRGPARGQRVADRIAQPHELRLHEADRIKIRRRLHERRAANRHRVANGLDVRRELKCLDQQSLQIDRQRHGCLAATLCHRRLPPGNEAARQGGQRNSLEVVPSRYRKLIDTLRKWNRTGD